MLDPLLSMRVTDGAGNDRHVAFDDLVITDSAQGTEEIRCTVLADTGDFTDLGPNSRIRVYPNSGGEPVADGYVSNPGATNGPFGSRYDLTATGPVALAADASYPYVAIDTSLERWKPSQYSTKGAVLDTADIDDDTVALQVTAPKDTDVTVANNVTYQTTLVKTARWTGDFKYGAIRAAGQRLARVVATFRAGVNDNDFLYGIRTRTGTGASADWVSYHVSALTPSTLFAKYGDANFGSTDDVANLRVSRHNSDATGVEDQIFQVYDITVRALLKDETGADITTGYTQNYVLAGQLIRDMIGRGMLPGIDPLQVTVLAGTAQITQFVFPDGLTFGAALEAIVVYEQDATWRLEAANAAGHPFKAYLWDDTNPRYDLDDERDGVVISGSDNDQCNRIVVAWTDRKGRAKTTTVGSYVPDLGNKNPVLPNGTIDPTFVGRIRDAESVSLPSELGTEGNAAAFGAAILARKATSPKAGQALVRRPIFDRLLGHEVMPFEIKAGYAVRRMSTGETIRLTRRVYSHSARAATLTLGSPVYSTEQLMADLVKRGPILSGKQVTPGLLTAIYHLKGTKKKG